MESTDIMMSSNTELQNCAMRRRPNVMAMLLKRGLFDDGEIEEWFVER